jgi:hypothetical protein
MVAQLEDLATNYMAFLSAFREISMKLLSLMVSILVIGSSTAFSQTQSDPPELTIWQNTYISCANLNSQHDLICELGAYEHFISETDVHFIFVPAGKEPCYLQVGKEDIMTGENEDPSVWRKTNSSLIDKNGDTLPMKITYVGDIYGEESFSTANVDNRDLRFDGGGLNLSPNDFRYPLHIKICESTKELQVAINAKKIDLLELNE